MRKDYCQTFDQYDHGRKCQIFQINYQIRGYGSKLRCTRTAFKTKSHFEFCFVGKHGRTHVDKSPRTLVIETKFPRIYFRQFANFINVARTGFWELGSWVSLLFSGQNRQNPSQVKGEINIPIHWKRVRSKVESPKGWKWTVAKLSAPIIVNGL